MKKDLVIFDLDGTLLDTLEDLKDSLNYALGVYEMPKRSLDEVRCFVGNGIRKLIERGVPEGTKAEMTDRVQAVFMEHYGEHCEDKTKPYDGIMEMLTKFREEEIHLAVVSNKADVAVKKLCDQYFPGIFDVTVGEREGVRKKPCPDSVREVLKACQIPKEQAVYVGDSEVDIETAKNAEMDAIIVDWGFREREFLLEKGAGCMVSSPKDIYDLCIR
ncbi:MAG: HAD family hydrolase [Muricoprocola sp.]